MCYKEKKATEEKSRTSVKTKVLEKVDARPFCPWTLFWHHRSEEKNSSKYKFSFIMVKLAFFTFILFGFLPQNFFILNPTLNVNPSKKVQSYELVERLSCLVRWFEIWNLLANCELCRLKSIASCFYETCFVPL